MLHLLRPNQKKQINTDEDPNKVKVNPVIPGYKVEEDPTGRGICLLVRDSLQVNRLPELEELNKPCIFAKISSDKNNYFYLGIFYRSPSSTNENNLNVCKQSNEICSF